MIPDSLAPGIVIRATDKTSARESGDEARANTGINRRIFQNTDILKYLAFFDVPAFCLHLCSISI